MKRLSKILVGLLLCVTWLGVSGARGAPPPVAPGPTQVQLVPFLPQFTVTSRSPAYTLNSNCSFGGGAITFHLTVSNTGAAPSPAITKDQGGVIVSTAMESNGKPNWLWSVAAALPAIPAHGSVPVDVTLMPLAVASQMGGTHIFGAMVNAVNHVKTLSTTGNTTMISVDVPAGFCPSRTLSPVHTLVKMASPTPTSSPATMLKIWPGSSSTTHAMPISVQVAPVVAAPANLQFTNDPQVCNQHAPGLAGGLICPTLIASTTALPLVWDWRPCTGVGCVSRPDGFRVYKVPAPVSMVQMQMVRLSSPTLVDTQSDPTLTIRGISQYAKTDCFVVTAYKGSTESSDSNQWCGQQNLVMGTKWVEVTPTTSYTVSGSIGLNCNPGNSQFLSNGFEGLIKYDTGSCTGDFVFHSFYGFDVSKSIVGTRTISRVTFVAYLVKGFGAESTLPCAITGVEETWRPPDVSILSRESVESLPGEVDPSTQRSGTISSNGVVADITPWILKSRNLGVAFAYTPDPIGDTQDTCLAEFKNVHLDVTYFP